MYAGEGFVQRAQRGRLLLAITLVSAISPCFIYAYGTDPVRVMLSRTVKDFSANLYKGVASKHQDNIAICPLAVQMALSLLKAGSGGTTFDEMLQVLQLPHGQNNTEAIFRQLLYGDGLKSTQNVQLYMTGAVFYQSGSILDPYWVTQARDIYATGVEGIDFRQQNAAARQINQWVEKRTRGTINRLVQPRDIAATTKLLILNAFYFRGSWSSPFALQNTTKQPFYSNNDRQVKQIQTKLEVLNGEESKITFEEQQPVRRHQSRSIVDLSDDSDSLIGHRSSRQARKPQYVEMMHQTEHFNYAIYEELDAAFVELPYVGKHLSMVVVLPNRDDGLRDLEAHMDQVLAFNGLYTANVELALPKFKIEKTFHLNDVLMQLGMREAFTDRADFMDVIVNDNVAINDVLQKTFLEVTEKGTEASAATVVGAITLSIPVTITDERFIADHPFLYILKDRRLDVPVFIGRYLGPNN